MAGINVWETLSSFEMWPGKTFFGLDKNEAHCFTLPKEITDSMIRHFGLREGKLQASITFIIAGKSYPATVRWLRMDRRNPNKLKREELPERDAIQFTWKPNEVTISAIRIILEDAFKKICNGSRNDVQSALFVHAKVDEFCIFPKMK